MNILDVLVSAWVTSDVTPRAPKRTTSSATQLIQTNSEIFRHKNYTSVYIDSDCGIKRS